MADSLRVLMVLLALVGPVTPATALSADEALERMSLASEQLHSLRAELRQLRSFPLLDLDDPPQLGSLLLARGKDGVRLRLELVSPRRSLLTLERGRWVYYQPELRQAVLGELVTGRQAPAAGPLGWLLAPRRELSGYQASLIDDGADGLVHLRLEPRPGQELAYRAIELWLDTQTWLPVRQALHEHDRSVTHLELSGLELGVEPPPGAFEQRLPAGTERVKG